MPPELPKDKLKFIVVAEGPGKYEVLKSRPLIGYSGRMLDAELNAAGLRRENAHLTNSVLCFGGDNSDKELEAAIPCCAPRLANELAALSPDIPILSLGAGASRVTIGKSGIQKYRGFVWTAPAIKPSQLSNAKRLYEKRAGIVASNKKGEKKKASREKVRKALDSYELLKARSQIAGRTILPTAHPAFILRGADVWLPVMRIDLRRLARLVNRTLKLEGEGPFEQTSSPRRAAQLLKKLGDTVTVDIETDNVDPMRCAITCVGVADVRDPRKAVVIDPWDDKKHSAMLAAALKKRTCVSHNGPPFDVIALKLRGIEFGKNEDTLVAHRVIASHMPQSLAHVSSIYNDSIPWKLKFKSGEEKGAVAGFGVSKEDLAIYNVYDIRLDALAWTRMQPELEKERALYEEDMQMAALYTTMQMTGIRVDQARRAALSKKLRYRSHALVGEMRKLLDRRAFMPSKPNDIRKALFGQLKAPIWLAPLTPTGLPSTAAIVLENLREQETRAGKLADFIIRWRSANDSRSEYLDGIHIHTDGRVRATWKQVETGRPATRAPNLLNLPRMAFCKGCGVKLRDGCEHGRKKIVDGTVTIVACKKRDESEPEDQLRDIYIASEGHKFAYFDLSQAEMRFAAHIANDPIFIASCKGDIHLENACILFPDAADKIRADPKGFGYDLRQIAKSMGFAVAYLAEAPTVFTRMHANGYDVAMDEVEAMLDNLHTSYRVYYKYCEDQWRLVQQRGWLRIPFSNRIRYLGHFPKINQTANCFDEETEALTQRGWVRGFDLKVGDRLLTKKSSTGALEWKPVMRLCLFPDYDGPLIEFKSKTFNAVTTPEHRWLVYDRKKHIDECRTSEYLADGARDQSIHRTGNYEAPPTGIYSDEFVELAGWVLTDGSIFPEKRKVSVYQSKPKNKRRIDVIVHKLNPKVGVDKRDFGGVVWRLTVESNASRLLIDLFPKRTLTIAFLLSLTKKQLHLLLETMLLGDGSCEPNDHHRRLTCRDRPRADAFQFLCTLCGYATTARWRGPSQPKKQYKSIANRPKSKGIWIVSILKRDKVQVIVHKRRYGKHKKPINQVRRFNAKAPVWCPVVSNTFFIVRRHGDVFCSGNTPVQGGVAGIMNKRLLLLEKRKTRGAKLIYYWYDAAIYDTPVAEVGDMEKIIKEVWAEPIVVPHNGVSFTQPIDFKIGERLGDF